MTANQKNLILRYELFGMLFISLLGGLLHFTFELSGYNPIVGTFSAVNESVWEHLKLGFWPILLFTIIEYSSIKKQTNNFFLAKTASAYTIILVIPTIFYAYTSITGESIFLIDILSFIIAVIICQFKLQDTKIQAIANNFKMGFFGCIGDFGDIIRCFHILST